MLNKNNKNYSHNKKNDGKSYSTKASSKKGKTIIKSSKLKEPSENKINGNPTGAVKNIPAEVKKTMPKLKARLAKLETQNKKLHSAQLKFKKERKKYSDVFEYAPVGYIIINKKDIIQEANRAACKMLGVSRAGLINKTIVDFILKEDRKIYYKLIKNIVAVWGQHSCELRMIKPKSLKFYASIEVSVLTSRKGQPALYGVCITNIDQRKSVEGEVKRHESLLENLVYEKTLQWININEKLTREVEALKESEDNLLDIRSNLNEAQELAHLGSWRWEIIPDEIYWSDETYRLFGWEQGEEIDFNKYLNAVLEEDKELVKEKVKAAVEEVKPYESEHRILRNGEIRFHHTIGKIYCDGDGKPIRMVGTVQDITDRKRAEEKLLNSYAWIEAIFEGSRDAVFVSDSESRFILVNQAACQLTGYTKRELLNMTIRDLHDTQDLNAYLSFHERIMSGEELLTEAKILTKDGHKVDTEFNNKRIIINRINYMHSSARDITERKNAEKSLRRAKNVCAL